MKIPASITVIYYWKNLARWSIFLIRFHLLMKNPVITIAVCWLVFLARTVPANANSAIGLDPLAQPYFDSAVSAVPLSADPVGGLLARIHSVNPETFFPEPLAGPASRSLADNLRMPAEAAATLSFGLISMDYNAPAIDSDNSDLRALFTPLSVNYNQIGRSGPNFSVSSELNGVNIQPGTPTLPEPSEFSLMLVGLAAIGVFVRLRPRKV